MLSGRHRRWLVRGAAGLAIAAGGLAALVYGLTFHPAAEQPAEVTCTGEAPPLQPGQSLRVLSWNVQYFAGKGYVFWYDLPNDAGPDTRPSPSAVRTTVAGAAELIRREAPDVLLLQEVDDGASRTDGQDQLAALQRALGDAKYPCSTSAFYWWARFVPHPKILGAVGMKLSILSRYRIASATRIQLPLNPGDPVTQQFHLKRAILEARLPVEGGSEVAVLDTHLSAFAQGSTTMRDQVAVVLRHLKALDAAGVPWILGGDFNLLPGPRQRAALPPGHAAAYAAQTELLPLIDAYPSLPEPAAAERLESATFTYFSNDPARTAPDRTIDYVFHSTGLTRTEGRVLRGAALALSDHLPLVGDWRLPAPR